MRAMEPTDDKELGKLTVLKPREVVEHFGRKRAGGEEPGKVLVESGDLIEMLEAVSGLKLSRRELLRYSPERLSLIGAPVKAGGKLCFVFPDQFDRLGFVLTLRQVYHLPLNTIRELDEHFPADCRHLVVERKLTVEELLDLAKMLPRGFAVKDLVMAKTCDLMVEDTLSPARAVLVATETGEALRKAEETAILSRLEELKQWVLSGRRQEFVKRKSAEDFKNLALNRLLAGKIVRKISAKRARHSRR